MANVSGKPGEVSMSVGSEPSRRGWIYPLILCAVGSSYYLCYFRYGISLGDEGFLVYGAERILKGQLPMSDFLSYPPGSYFLLALLFKIFSVHLLVSRLMEMAFLLINGLMLFYIGKRLMPKIWALLPAFTFVLLPGPWHKVFFIFALLLPLAALFRFLEKMTTVRMLVVGGAIGIALLFKLESAFYASLTTFVVVWAQHWKGGTFRIERKGIFLYLKDISLCCMGAILIILPVLIYYFLNDSLGKLLLSFSTSNMANLGKLSGYFGKPSLVDAITKFRVGNLANLFFFLILLLYVCFIAKVFIEIFIKENKTIPSVFPIVVLGLLSLTYVYSVFGKSHLLQSAPLAYILFAYAMYTVFQKKERRWNAAAVVLVFILGLYIADGLKWRTRFYSGSISRVFSVRQEETTVFSTPKARLYLSQKESDTINGLIQHFEGKKDYLVPLYFEPMVNFLTGLDNPTSFSYFFPPLIQETSKQKQAIYELEKHKVKYLFIAQRLWINQQGFGFNDYAPTLYEFVIQHYRLEKEIGDYLIFCRLSL